MENKPLGHRMGEVARLFHNRVKKIANDNGVSTTYFHIIGFLKRNKENNITQKEICEYIKMKAPTISLTLQSMEQDGLVERVKSDVDSRCTYVVLTKKGEELDDKIKGFFVTTEKLMESFLTEEELKTFISCLDKISKGLEG
jgi:DNA-binding MarR family transcriptional regulator